MDEFSLEALREKIYNHKSKEYFLEIVSSYNNKNYRSATVMLWSIAVIDLVFKLKDLEDLHEDKSAKDILKEMQELQTKDKKSSAWENKLIKEVFDRTNLLSSDNFSFLEYLYQQRNLSAHPVLDANLELHRPNKETIRSLIVNTVDGILCKPPFFAKDIITTIVIDLEESKEFLEDSNKIKHYLESRFLSKMTTNVKLEVFKSLWKFVFKLENDKTQANRNVNFQALEYLYSSIQKDAEDKVKNESAYFSNISKSDDTLFYLIKFLSLNTELYKHFEKSAQILLSDRTDKGEKEFFYSNFRYKNLTEFYDKMLERINNNEINLKKSYLVHLKKLSDSPEWFSKLLFLVNAFYGKSGSYEKATTRFSQFVAPVLKKYGEDEIKDLLEKANSNSQIYDRHYSKHINTDLKKRADEILGEDFDYSPYPNFFNAVE